MQPPQQAALAHPAFACFLDRFEGTKLDSAICRTVRTLSDQMAKPYSSVAAPKQSAKKKLLREANDAELGEARLHFCVAWLEPSIRWQPTDIWELRKRAGMLRPVYIDVQTDAPTAD